MQSAISGHGFAPKKHLHSFQWLGWESDKSGPVSQQHKQKGPRAVIRKEWGGGCEVSTNPSFLPRSRAVLFLDLGLKQGLKGAQYLGIK